MAEPTNDNDDMYALDKWLRKFGLWRDTALRRLSDAERKAALDRKDFSRPFVWQRAAYDPEGRQLITLTSHTSYDPETGIFDDKIVYWRHRPWEGEAKAGQKQDHYVLQIRGIRDPASKPSGIPHIIPEQIWWNGSQIFDGPAHGGPHSPYRPEYVKLINRMVEFSKRVKERLNNPSSPLQEVGQDFASAALSLNMAKAVSGSAQNFRGLNDKGWSPVDSTIHSFFTRASEASGQKLSFSLPPIKAQAESLMPGGGGAATTGDISSLERLHVVNGYYQNTVEPVRQMMEGGEEATTSFDSGVSYLAGTDYYFDSKTNRHVYSHMIVPEDPMDGTPVPDPFEVVHLEYAQKGDVFTLEQCSFMGSPAQTFKTLSGQLSVVGFNVACNDDLIVRKYPGYKDHAYTHKLQQHIHEMGIPSKLLETGGDFGWVPFNGCGFDKKVDIFADSIGGGHGYFSRGLKEDGTISEVMVLHDLPLSIGGPDSDYDGMNPNFMPYIEALRKGAIVFSHDHFDHASLEYLAKQVDENGNGWLKGVPVVCREDIAYIIKKRLGKLEIPKTQWPHFKTYERPDGSHHPDLIKTGDHTYAYCVRDEDGKARLWVQACANGSLHSAETDIFSFTGCYGDEVYHDTFLSDGDALDIRPHGQEFMARGQLGLLGIPGISQEKLTANITNPEELYIGLDEVTNVTSDGDAPTIDQFKNTLRKVLKTLPKNRIVIHHPFSTSHLEIRASREVCNEPETLRNTTSVGANAEIRDACMNIHGVDPLIDLRKIEIPPDKLPQAAYGVAFHAILVFLEKRRKTAKRLKFDVNDDIQFRVFEDIYKLAKAELDAGNKKPQALYDAFFSGNTDAFDEIAEGLGFARGPRRRAMPDLVRNALESYLEEYLEDFDGDYKDVDTTYYMLNSLIKHGKVIFKSKGNWNDSHMAQGILREQETVSRRATRGSKRGKAFRVDPGNLWILSTGATGSAEEQFSSLSRYARGDALFDYSELTRNTGYKLENPSEAIFFITQTPSMGEDAQIAQEALVRDVVNNRGNTVFQAFRNGFYIHNPGKDRAHYMKTYREEGWNPEWDAVNNRIRVTRQPFHVHGHRFWGDLRKKYESKYYKTKLVEFVHMPSHASFQRGRELAARTNRRTSIDKPEDYVFQQCRKNEKGEPFMHKSAFLTPSYWLFQIKRKYGLQYGGIVKMVLAIVMKRTGGRFMDALEARSGADGHVTEHAALQLSNDWLKARNGSASARQNIMGPSLADIQPAGGKPMGRTASSLVHQARWAGGTYSSPHKEAD